MNVSKAGALARLRAASPALSETERKVADWILSQPDGLLTSSMMDVARACDVSDTTVLRMCRNSDFSGFTDLKLALAHKKKFYYSYLIRFRSFDCCCIFLRVFVVFRFSTSRDCIDFLSSTSIRRIATA